MLIRSHEYLVRGGFINQVAAGLYDFLPLGFLVLSKLDRIIKEELSKKGVQHLLMPFVHPASLWKETGRYDKIDVLLKFTSARGTDCVLAPTHEETVTDLARKYLKTYKDLPVILNQNQWKYRDEMRATGGLLRTREFLMQDAYSFDCNDVGLDENFKKMSEAYHAIFERIGLDVTVVKADSGTMGGSDSEEFMVLADAGEDKILICDKCDYGMNLEKAEGMSDGDLCTECGKGNFKIVNAIEAGHVFKLGTCYAESMKAYFVDEDGSSKPVIMGCYGIGISRLVASIAEVSNDENGLIWPKNVAPFQINLLSLGKESEVLEKAEELYGELVGEGFEVLYDDRDESAGKKFADSDLIGIPVRLIVSKRSLEAKSVELKYRSGGDAMMIAFDDLSGVLQKFFK